jgi:hypothetical protein
MRLSNSIDPTNRGKGTHYIQPQHARRGCGLGRDRRGVAAAAFALLAAVLLGVAALATEAANWYMARERAFSAADAAATAAVAAFASAYYNQGATLAAAQAAAQSAAVAVAALNGLDPANPGAVPGAASVAVTVSTPPPASSPYASDPAATAIDVSIGLPVTLAAIVPGQGGGIVTVTVASVASLQQVSTTCALALAGTLYIQMGIVGGQFVGDCYAGSNGTGDGAGGTDVVLADAGLAMVLRGFTSQGTCNGCPAVDPLWGLYPQGGTPSGGGFPSLIVFRPTADFQPPSLDPYAGIAASLAWPAAGGFACPDAVALGWASAADAAAAGVDPVTHCPASPLAATIDGGDFWPSIADREDPAAVSPWCPAGTVCAYYNLDIHLRGSIVMHPGAYLLMNASLFVDAGAIVQCDPTDWMCNLATDYNHGVTIAMGNPTNASPKDAGVLSIDPTASVYLTASGAAEFPAAAYPSSPLNGFIAFRDGADLLPDSEAAPAVRLADDLSNPNGPTHLEGVAYFPGAVAWSAVNVDTSYFSGVAPACFILAAGTLHIGYWTGFASLGPASNLAFFAGTGCFNYNIGTLADGATMRAPVARAIMVVQ